MVQFKTGYLFKKYYITYQKEKHEIFEFVDYVAGIPFINIDHENICNVLTGNHAGVYAYILNEKANEEEYVFYPDNFDIALKNNDYQLDFEAIRKKIIKNKFRYYVRYNKTNLIALSNEDLIAYLEHNNKSRSGFDEDVFEKTSDISSM